jgi:predicted dehydrogenase
VIVATLPRLGFVGVGWIGRNRLDAVARSGLAEIAGVADAAPGAAEEAAASVGASAAAFEELLDGGLDGIVIATPSALHAGQATLALEHGLAVFCQKPLGRDEPETRAVVEAARRADLLLAVDLSYRYTQAAQAVRDAVAGLGRVDSAELVFHNAYGPDKAWFYDRELAGGGCLVDLGTHLVDLALWTLRPARVEVEWARTLGEPVERRATAQLALDATSVRIACSWGLPVGRDAVIEAAFYGEGRGAALRNVDGSFLDLRAERYDGTTTTVLTEPPDDWGGRAAVDWARRLGAGERFDPACEELVRVAGVVDRIYAASRA